MRERAANFVFEPGREFASELDRLDPLGRFRQEFYIPRKPDGSSEVYLVGNSLGLQPKRTSRFVEDELAKWRELAVRAHFEGDHPWMPYHEFLTEPMANIAGAKDLEIVVMNSLTTNLHLMMASFYQPTPTRPRILIEGHAFPSDRYAVESQIRFRGFDPADSLVEVSGDEDGGGLLSERVIERILQEGESIALILIPGVQYYSGEFLDIGAITDAAHSRGCLVGIDLAHAVGNVPLRLHDWGIDFAVWCTYKYLNSGPGSVGGCFVHERWARTFDLPRFAGWWGHDKETRFLMGPEFHPIQGAEGWQLSNPPILSLAAIRASLEVFSEAGGMQPLREKSVRLTAYLEWLLITQLSESIRILTPANPDRRGAQLSLQVQSAKATGRRVYEGLESAGVRCDWREPDVIRVAPVPLYNSFSDVFAFVEILQSVLR